MIHGSDLSELRTTYNGSYGASMLFYPKEMTYYVALFQQKTFWRVIKTEDETRAEMIYKDFVRQTLQLSDVEIRRTRLEAQKAFTERMIALSQDRANRLQADLNVAHQQQTIVNSQQQQTRAEAAALAQQKTTAQAQLREAQRQVEELQRQLDSGLPTMH
jgi:chromosome segregation ATPase